MIRPSMPSPTSPAAANLTPRESRVALASRGSVYLAALAFAGAAHANTGEVTRADVDRAAVLNTEESNGYSYRVATPNRVTVSVDPVDGDSREYRQDDIDRRTVVRIYRNGRKIGAAALTPDSRGGEQVTRSFKTKRSFRKGDKITLDADTTAKSDALKYSKTEDSFNGKISIK